MSWLKTIILIATTLVLLGIDALIGLSGALYMPPIAGVGLLAFIVAVPLLIATGQGSLLFPAAQCTLGIFSDPRRPGWFS